MHLQSKNASSKIFVSLDEFSNWRPCSVAPLYNDQFENLTDCSTFAQESIFEQAMKIKVLFLLNGIYRRLQTTLIVTNRSVFGQKIPGFDDINWSRLSCCFKQALENNIFVWQIFAI